MILRCLSILLLMWASGLSAQSVVIDIEYQPNTTYEWTRLSTHDMSIEYLGAEDMGDVFQQLGIDPYSERQEEDFIQVTMKTGDRTDRKLPYTSTIDTLQDYFMTTNPRHPENNRPPLEIDDLEIHGVVNHFQKIEIDSIHGVDSLSEKNNVFKLLDDIHRSLSYPKDTMTVGQSVEKTMPYNTQTTYESAELTTTYVLEKIEQDVAHIKMDYQISTKDSDVETDSFLDKRTSIGTGSGKILYDSKHKQVIYVESNIKIDSFRETMELSVESSVASVYKWTMNVIGQ